MKGPKQVGYDPQFGLPWGYPLPFYPPSNLPPIRKQASVRGLRPTNRKTTDHHPIAPVNPFPPDPYIQQFGLSEALEKGTLFQWLHTADRDESKAVITKATEKEVAETSAAENSRSEKPQQES